MGIRAKGKLEKREFGKNGNWANENSGKWKSGKWEYRKSGLGNMGFEKMIFGKLKQDSNIGFQILDTHF